MEVIFSKEFRQRHINAHLPMDHANFGFNPYTIGSFNHAEWQNGFSWAFERGDLIIK